MAITDWPATERPREKLLELGAAALSDAELLAIFLRTGLPGLTAVDLARELLDQSGGLRALLELGRSDFCANKGLCTPWNIPPFSMAADRMVKLKRPSIFRPSNS